MKDLFYIAGGVVGGWIVAKKIFGSGSSYRRNPKHEDWDLDWLDMDGEPSKFESNVVVEGETVGSIVKLTPKKWQAYDKKLMPFGEFASADAAGRAVYNKWSNDKFLADIFGGPTKPTKKTPTPPPKPKTPTPKPKGPYEILWESSAKIGADVHAEGQFIGSIRFDDAFGKWEAFEETQALPFSKGISSAKKAAEKVFKRFKGLRDLPEPKLVSVKLPDWITDVEIEPTVGAEGERFLIWVGDDRAGVIGRRGHNNYDAYIFTKRGDFQLEIGVSRQRAIRAVYVAHKILKYLPRQKIRGKKWYYVQQSASEISEDLGIPEKEIILYGQKLASLFLVYGVKTKRRQKSFKKIEVIGKETPPQKGRRKRHRRMISHQDIEKLRKGGMLSKEERKALPSIRQKTVYYFAMLGPKGEVGFHGA